MGGIDESSTPTPGASVTALLRGGRAQLHPSDTSTPLPTPTPDLAERLALSPMPPVDYVALVTSLLGGDQAIPLPTRQSAVRAAVGDQRPFWIGDMDVSRFYQITATLRLQSEYAQMWVEEPSQVEQSALESSATVFDTRIYPTLREYFGQEWSPGIDGDSHLLILNARFGGATGYFSAVNEYPRWVNVHSNEAEMFVMNLAAVLPGTPEYDSVLAHEFQHMIHWRLDANEDAWVNEGASDLAEEISGGEWPQAAVRRFERRPDLQLNAWTDDDNEISAHYGASYLIMRYFLDRFGPKMLHALVQDQRDGIAAFDAVLAEAGISTTFNDLFADWVVANVLDAPELADGRYGYPGIDVKVEEQCQIYDYPYSYEGEVHQYGADYLELFPSAAGPLRIAFRGAPEVRMVPNEPASGSFQWWSNRGDAGHAYLQRAFDLTQATTATLSFALWYDIEAGWDYAYIRASTDGGKSWRTLKGAHLMAYDPAGDALGPAYTGKSGVPLGNTADGEAMWVEERLDLSEYCGSQVIVRFDYVTDEAVNRPGLCLDDIRLDAVGFFDDVESGEDEWQAVGFLRHDNRLRQSYIVQVVEFDALPRVTRLPVDAKGQAEAVIDSFGGEVQRALLIVSAIAPTTTEATPYTVRLEVSS